MTAYAKLQTDTSVASVMTEPSTMNAFTVGGSKYAGSHPTQKPVTV